ncbi:unnamed protein product [Lymnaea stagnalis]|uniref:Uncharacterized protein n=1 Tax=Lymnaea stagnalis TaxID=6523 RepID=A0AAV2I4B9_LYMST
MKEQPYLSFWLLFGIYMHICSAQEVQFYTLNQEHCQTKCTHGLINNLDSCQLDLKIQFYEFVPNSTLFYFEDIDDQSQNIFSLDIPSECIGYKHKANNYCTQINKTAFNVTVIVPAQPKFSNVKLRGYLKTSNGDRIESKLFTFPEIHDSTNVTGKLLINEEITSTIEDCSMTIKKNDLILEFDCFGTVTPCLIVIQVNGSIVNTTSGNLIVYRRTLENREELFINISFAACSMERDFKSITCIIKQDSEEYLKEISTSDDAIILAIASCSILAIILIAVIVYIYCRKKDNELCKPSTCRVRRRKQRQSNV